MLKIDSVFSYLGELTSISTNNEASSAPALCSANRDLAARESSVSALQITTVSQFLTNKSSTAMAIKTQWETYCAELKRSHFAQP
jgi:hypothetical protein